MDFRDARYETDGLTAVVKTLHRQTLTLSDRGLLNDHKSSKKAPQISKKAIIAT